MLFNTGKHVKYYKDFGHKYSIQMAKLQKYSTTINIYIHAKHYTYYMKHISARKLRSAIDTMRYFSFCHRKVGNERKWKDAEALGVVSFHGNGGV